MLVQIRNSEEEEKRDLVKRTKRFALRVIRLYCALPKTTEAQVIGKQLLRSGTSVGAHYREARRARSDAEFLSKIEVALQELEESEYWLELMHDAEIVKRNLLINLQREVGELLAILAATAHTLKKRTRRK